MLNLGDCYHARVAADSEVRTEFGPAPGNLRSALILLLVGPLIVAVPAWFAASRDRASWYVALALLGLVGIAFTVAGSYLLSVWLPRYRLLFGPHGIQLRWQRQTVEIPWSYVRSWWLGVPPGAARAAMASETGAPRPVLLVEPAEQVTDPGAGPRRTVWSRRRQVWQVCEPSLIDGTTQEVMAALERYAPELAATSAPVATPARNERRLPLSLLAPILGMAVLSVLALAVAVSGFIAIVAGDSGVDVALAAMAAPGIAGVLLAAGTVRMTACVRR